jgi:hypothetical protein
MIGIIEENDGVIKGEIIKSKVVVVQASKVEEPMIIKLVPF